MQQIIRTITLSEREPSIVKSAGSAYAGTYGDQLSILFDDELPHGEQYGYCLHGVASGTDTGLGYYESDDIFGFASEEEAEAAGREATT